MFPRFDVTPSAPSYGSSGAWNPGNWKVKGPVGPSILGGPAATAILKPAESNTFLGGPAGSAILRGGSIDITA